MTGICAIKISFADIGLQRGYGVFDFASTYNGKLFRFKDYLARFHISAAELRLEIPITNEKIKEIAEHLISISELENPAIRLLITGGISNMDLKLDQPNFIISAENLPGFPKELYVSGSKLVTYGFQRELPHVKSLNYMNFIRLDPLKRQKGATDFLYYSEHGITESPRHNFFMFRGNTLITPKDHILHGITRKVVLELAKEKFIIEERAIHLDELQEADEAFNFNTSDYLPVNFYVSK